MPRGPRPARRLAGDQRRSCSTPGSLPESPAVFDHRPLITASAATIADKTLELPARQVLEKIKQLAVPGDHPHLGRNRPILQGMSVNHRHARVIFHPPAHAFCASRLKATSS